MNHCYGESAPCAVERPRNPGGGETEILPTENRGVLAYRRAHPRSAPFLSITNFSDFTQTVGAGLVTRARLREPRHLHSTTGDLAIAAESLELPPWSFAWLTGT
jgi:hypothetical protein